MSSNNTIAKNTLYLYFRMFFNLGVTLFTSRIVLKTLGVEDFGIYNLVAGFVVMFSFINGSMSAASQRFLNVEIAHGEKKQINKVFCTSMNVHILVTILILVLGETLGLWFINNQLNIPIDRMYAANWVYQMSLITAVVNITRVPYNALIIAYQRMSIYAYLGIFETIMKLVIVYILVLQESLDHLIVYAVLFMVVNILINIIYRVYCRKNFDEESAYYWHYDRKLTSEMALFSGWNLFGQLANIGASQGLYMILNVFVGVTVNAAVGIATQVNAAVYSFITNFQTAFNPQITQSYALKDFENHKKLLLFASKFSFFLLAILATPILLNTAYILDLWLGNMVPTFAKEFTQIVILISLIDALAGPFWMSVHATGRIKIYQFIISLILLINLPLAYIMLWQGYSPPDVLKVKLILNGLVFAFRFWYAGRLVDIGFSKSFNYVRSIVPTFILLLLFIFYSNSNALSKSLLDFIKTSLFAEIILIFLVIVSGIEKNEKKQILNIIKIKLKRNVTKN